ncbi:glutathione synthase [Orobanche gracilis]
MNTEKFYTEVQENILARYNKTFEWSLKAKMMGMKAIEAARVFVEETGISDSLSAEDFLIQREDMLRDLFPSSELMPGSHRRHFELKTQHLRGGPVDPRKILVFEDAPSGVLAAKNAGIVGGHGPRSPIGYRVSSNCR